MDDFFQELAKAQTQGKSDGDFFKPNQKGVVAICKLIRKKTAAKQSVILVAEVLESHPKVSGAQVQPPGTKVKKIYAISKREWAINELKTDLLNIAGIDEAQVAPAQLPAMFEEAFEQNRLLGVATTFDTTEKEREGKQTLTRIYFGHAAGDINSAAEVAKRAEKYKEESKK